MVSVRTGTVLFPGGSWVQGRTGPQDSCHQACVYTDSGVVRMSGKLGCVTECEATCGVPAMPSFIQGLAIIITMENLAPQKKKTPSCLEPLSPSWGPLLPVQAKLHFPPLLLLRPPTGRGSCPAAGLLASRCNPLLASSQDQHPGRLAAPPGRWSRSQPSLIRISQGCQGNC